MNPNPWDYSSRQQGLGIAIIFGFTAFALGFTSLRVYSRVVTKTFGLDDGFIIVAMIISLAHTAGSYIYMKHTYIGFHIWDVPVHDPENTNIWQFVILVLYNPILAIVKMSILIFLLRLGGYKTGVRNTILTVGAINFFMMIGCLFAIIFQCVPLEANWFPSTVEGKCINRMAYYVSRACLNVATDLLVMAVPVFIFWDLKMNKRVRWALIFVFLLGLITTIIGVVRLYLLLWPVLQPELKESDWTYSVAFTLSVVEVNIAIWAACVPAIWPLARLWFPGFFARMGLQAGRPERHMHQQQRGPFRFSARQSSGNFRRRSMEDPVVAYQQRFKEDGKHRKKVAPFLTVNGEMTFSSTNSSSSTTRETASRSSDVSAVQNDRQQDDGHQGDRHQDDAIVYADQRTGGGEV